MPDLDHTSTGRPQAAAAASRLQAIGRMSLLALTAFVVALWAPVALSAEFDGSVSALVLALQRAVPATRAVLATIDQLTLFQGVPLVALAFASFALAASERRRAGLILGCLGVAAAYGLSGVLILASPHFAPSSSRAILLVGLATTILLTDRRVGLIAAFVAALGLLARLAGGGHAADLLAGAVLGAAAARLSAAAAAAWPQRWTSRLRAAAPLFAVLAFMAASQLANAFDDLQMIGDSLSRHLGAAQQSAGCP